MKKKLAVILIALLLVIQFIRPAKNQSVTMLATDITQVTQVPDSVLQILKTSCYDCHSNKTNYPWYFNIQPVALWLNNHVKEGKEKLNFSDFGSYDFKKANKKRKGIIKELKEDEMPLTSYTLIHRNAILDSAKKEIIIRWAKNNMKP